MKKITFYKNMTGYDEQKGGYYFDFGYGDKGYHFEADQGYLHICPNGLQVAMKKLGYGWRATELSSGMVCSPDGQTIKELKENLAIASVVAKKFIDNPSASMATTIKALKAYAKQQQRIAV